MKAVLSIAFSVVILIIGTPQCGRTAQVDMAEAGFDSPAEVGQAASPGLVSGSSGKASNSAVRPANLPPAQINSPKGGGIDVSVEADPPKTEPARSGLAGILSVLIPTQEDLEKAFQSQARGPGLARQGAKKDKNVSGR